MSLLPGGPWSSFVRAAGVFGAPLLIIGGTQTFTASGSYPVPSTAAYARVQGWGPGNTGAASVSGTHSGGAGGGGEYAEEPQLLAAGDTLTVTIGAGAATTITGGPVTITANPGSAASGQTGGNGGTGSTNTIHFNGGNGGSGLVGTNRGGAGGGSSAGPSAPGNNGSAGGVGTFGSGATAPAGGGNGGNGGSPSTSGVAGQAPGGGGGGGGDGALHGGGGGAGGQAIVTWYYYSTVPAPVSARGRAGVMPATRSQGSTGAPVYSVTPGQVAPFTSPRKASAGRSGARTGRAQSSAGVPPVPVVPGPPAVFTPPSSAPRVRRGARTGRAQSSKGAPVIPVPVLVVNQWAATFAQPAAFQTTPPALQSTVVALTPAASVGGGTGTPSAGNWLFAVCGWNQAGLPAVTVGDADDIHSFWRPGDVTTSTWAVSASAGKTRTSIWYTPNLARVPGDVYAAPSGAMAGMACTVFEVSGLGPWDTVTGVYGNYAAAVTSLNLTLGAPSGQAFLVGAVCGDSSAAGQAFAPAGWSTLATVTAANGADHSCDAVLTSAILTTSGSVSVNATTGAAADLSGVIIGVLKTAPSPITASGVTSAWPGRMIVEAAFGAGFETPPDQMTWTVLNDSAVSPAAQAKRFWGWADDGGIPYALAQLQSGTGTVTLDNADGALTPSNAASPYYPDVVTGTPVRLRAAIGTLTGPLGSTAVNRWYVIQRNMLDAQEKRSQTLRNYVDMSLTDIWSVVSGTCPSVFRGEVRQDSPQSWWAMDDQPLSGGVLPTSLRNSAAGNTNPLVIYAASGGVTAAHAYTTAGTDATATNTPPTVPPSVATYSVGALAGWMYGDPQSSPASYSTGNPVTSSPGSAAWQQAGLAGTGGSNGWFLAANDTSFPPLASGASAEIWFSAAFFGTAQGQHFPTLGNYQDVAGQPYSPITIATLATASAPVAVLQLDLSGHLILTTYHGGTGTSTTIYSASDLRSNSFHQVVLTATTTTWTVYVDGGLTASVSGSATGMTSAWTWLILGADCGAGGGGSLSSATHMGNVAYSHAITYPQVLPAWRVRARYAAAITGFGVLPAPQTVSLTEVANQFGTGFTPDGSLYQGSYGDPGASVGTYTFSALAVAQAGAYTSGPGARTTVAGLGGGGGGIFFGNAVFVSFTSLSPQAVIYTAASADAETAASVVCGSGDSYSSGFGAAASASGVCHVSGGSGASPPSAPSSLGDDVGQRIERVLGYGLVTYPGRAIDPAPLAVQAASDVGGQQTGANVQNIVSSDNGMLFVDSPGNLCYRGKAHLASDTVVWNLSSAGPSHGYPFQAGQVFQNDPQKVFDVIQVTPYSPDGASLAVVTPADAAAVDASQEQYGPRPLSVTSYLQSGAAQQSQADWLFATYGSLHRRVESLTVDAAGYPPAWLLVLGASVGDLVQITDQPMQGGPQSAGTYRISSLSRRIFFGANGSKPQGTLTIVADPLPPGGYWG